MTRRQMLGPLNTRSQLSPGFLVTDTEPTPEADDSAKKAAVQIGTLILPMFLSSRGIYSINLAYNGHISGDVQALYTGMLYPVLAY